MSLHYLKLEHHTYLWTLGALVLVYFGSIMAAAFVPSIIGKIEAFGLGTITGGLIGLLRIPRQPPSSTSPVDPVVDDTLDLTQSMEEK